MADTLLNTIPGTRDLLPDELARWQLVEGRARSIFARYGFDEIRTPILEATELFARGIGGDTDIVGKEMYTFQDQSGKSITLRPEATASVVRAYVQHAMHREAGVTKLYYIGPMFRHEKKQKGRWRQFFQIGAEVLGSDHAAIEAETIEMVLLLLESVGVQASLQINSVGCANCRPAYLELLRRDLRKQPEALCEDCRRRIDTNPLRVLDCKVEACQPLIDQLPMITDHLCDDCARHFAQFKSYLSDAGIAYQVVPRLVRGLDYYVRTAFEIVSGELGAQNAVVGGGRYDGLAEVLGGPPTHGFGFALGLDRLIMLLPEKIREQAVQKPDLLLAYMGEAALRKAICIARQLRREGIRCHFEFGGGSLKSQLRLANRINARHALIIGENELAKGLYMIRHMDSSDQREISLSDLSGYLQSHRTGQPA
jgi:histidyl-tRNA synthetase